MPEWTQTIGDIQKIAGLMDFLDQWMGKEASVELTSGVRLQGVILPGRVGNNAGAGGRWAYYASIAIRTENEDVEVDFLDVVAAHPL